MNVFEKNLFEKEIKAFYDSKIFKVISKTEIYKRFIGRVTNPKTIANRFFGFFSGTLLMLIILYFFIYTSIEPKLENELYETTGIVKKVKIAPEFGRADISHIYIQTKSGETVSFYFIADKDNNITPRLRNQKVTIYSNSPSYAGADKVIDSNGNIIKHYNYQIRKEAYEFERSNFIPILTFLNLLIIWILNRK